MADFTFFFFFGGSFAATEGLGGVVVGVGVGVGDWSVLLRFLFLSSLSSLRGSG